MPLVDPHSTLTLAGAAPCCVVFGADSATIQIAGGVPHLAVAAPVLAGRDREEILRNAHLRPQPAGATCASFASRDRLAGFAVSQPALEPETAAHELYRQLFALTAGLHLYRIWNYVPGINDLHQGLENYRHFCRGRSLAFEDHRGKNFQRWLPAASAIGSQAGRLAIAFLAGGEMPRHFENPDQVPAFKYPPAYGPRPPSFSRATLIATAEERELFVSGTAAIRGHATVAVDDLSGQLKCTRENLNTIAATAGAGRNFGAADGWSRSFKVFIRHSADLPLVRRDLEAHLLGSDDQVIYLQANLCRGDLRVEIEAVLKKSTP
jgi:chorismate lyase / 3-hydroxybenzoate synthase